VIKDDHKHLLILELNSTLHKFQEWIKQQKDVLAVGIVGSHARGEAREDSDIDVIILSQFPDRYITDISWVDKFGEIKRKFKEDWGVVQTIRAYYEDGLEVEYSIAPKEWANINPVNEGTHRVVNDGMIILCDKEGLLEHLQKAVKK